MCTIDIGIGHDDYFMVTNLAQVERFRVIFCSKSDTESGEDITYFLGLEHFVLHSFLDIQDLTAQWKNSLVNAVTSCFSRTACRITLDEEEFAFGWVLGSTIGEFTGQTTTAERRFAEYTLTGITGSDTCLCSKDNFLDNLLGIIGMLFEVISQGFCNGAGNHTCHFGVTEFGLGLAFELRLCHFDGNNGCQTFTEVVRVDSRVTVLIFEFGFLEQFAILGIFLHHASKCCTETGYVCTTFDGVDVIYVGVYILVEVGVVNHRHFDGSTVFLCAEMNHFADKRSTRLVDITHKLT